MPGHPGRGPHGLGNPKPADARLEIPSAVMVGSPTPRFVAHPVPSGVGAFPMPIGVGTPIGFDTSRDPTAAVVGSRLVSNPIGVPTPMGIGNAPTPDGTG